MTAGMATGGLKGRRLNIEKPIAGLRACGAACRFVIGILVFLRTNPVHIWPNVEVISVWSLVRDGKTYSKTES